MAESTKISPSQFIPLTYQLPEGVSAPVRYIQAKIIKPSDRSVLATVNLTDNGNGDFSDYSKTPSAIGIGENNYLEVIITVYTDSGYTTPDNLTYATTKYVYYVKEEYGGAILGGRETGEIDLSGLVQKIFEFNPSKVKVKNSFAQRFLNVAPKIDQIGIKIDSNGDKLQESINSIAQNADYISQALNILVTSSSSKLQEIESLISKINNEDIINQAIETNALISESREQIIKSNKEISKKIDETGRIKEISQKIAELQAILSKDTPIIANLFRQFYDWSSLTLRELINTKNFKGDMIGLKLDLSNDLTQISDKLDDLNDKTI